MYVLFVVHVVGVPRGDAGWRGAWRGVRRVPQDAISFVQARPYAKRFALRVRVALASARLHGVRWEITQPGTVVAVTAALGVLCACACACAHPLAKERVVRARERMQ